MSAKKILKLEQEAELIDFDMFDIFKYFGLSKAESQAA